LATSSDILAKHLYDAGCRYAFGIPGGEVVTIIDALERAGIKFVLTKHENNAGFMAEGVYHRTGVPGIMVATLGPGVANGINVIANAHQDKVPLIYLTGCVDEDEALTYTHQVFDHQKLLEPITKNTYRLTADSANIIADRAVSLALDDRPGPVHIDIPIGVAKQTSTPSMEIRRVKPSPVAPAPGQDLSQAKEWLEQAKKPIVIAGLDVMNHSASDTLRAFIEHINAPLITTYKAKGVVPEDHRLCLGGAGLSPLADKHLLPLIEDADLILCIGYDPIEMRTGWRNIWDVKKQKVIEISAVSNDHYMHHAGLHFICDIKEGIEALLKKLPTRHSWPENEPSKVRIKLKEAFQPEEDWGPSTIIHMARNNLPRNTIATADSGAHRILQSQIWECYEPSTLLQSSALCTMGCAVPLAIGAKIADPDRCSLAFTGDAGLLMILGELASLEELAIPIVIIVFVDASLALIELKQRGVSLPNRGVDFGKHDFAAIANAMGGNGIDVTCKEEMEAALAKAVSSDKFTVIACHIDRKAYDGKF